MLAVADEFGLDKPVLGGSSMGSATALYAAIQEVSLFMLILQCNKAFKKWETQDNICDKS